MVLDKLVYTLRTRLYWKQKIIELTTFFQPGKSGREAAVARPGEGQQPVHGQERQAPAAQQPGGQPGAPKRARAGRAG